MTGFAREPDAGGASGGFVLARTITHRFTGEQVTFVRTASDTDGEYLELEVALPPRGDGPPLHSHLTFTEEFTCIEGTLSITHGKQNLELAPGESAIVAVGTNHTFTNNADVPLRFGVTLTPPSLFEESMRVHYGLMDDGLTDDKGALTDKAHLAFILLAQDTLIAGVPRKLQRWLFRVLVARGKKRGAFDGFEKYTGRVIDL